MGSRLTKEDVDFYNEHGYLLFHQQVFAPDVFAELNAIFEALVANKGDKRSDELNTPHFEDERLVRLLLHDDVLDLVEPLIGPNIGLWSSHFISKEPHVGRATPWHEDSAYWEGRISAYERIVTMWLALDKVTDENGCMRVVPGTHHNGFSEYEEVDRSANTLPQQIKDIKITDSVPLEMERGECSLHDSRIIHGAEPNRSPYRRAGYTMRYFDTAQHVIPEKNSGHKFWLARGKDMGNNYFENA